MTDPRKDAVTFEPFHQNRTLRQRVVSWLPGAAYRARRATERAYADTKPVEPWEEVINDLWADREARKADELRRAIQFDEET